VSAKWQLQFSPSSSQETIFIFIASHVHEILCSSLQQFATIENLITIKMNFLLALALIKIYMRREKQLLMKFLFPRFKMTL
jgi:hypothetical protein